MLQTVAAAGMAAALLLATAADAKPWRHGIIEAKSDAGFVTMVGQGFAAKQGLELELLQFKSDIPALQALLAGELDSYEGGLGGAILAAARGGDVKVFGCYWGPMLQGLFVRAEIRSVADLKGRTIAISAPGGMPDLMARALLAANDIPADAVRFANLGSDLDRFKALAAGIADAGIASSEFATVADPAKVKLLQQGSEIFPDYLRFCLQATGKRLAERHADAIRFAAAEMAALRYALGHREAEIALTRKATDAKPDDPRPAYVFDFVQRTGAVDPTLPLPPAKLDWMQQELVRDGRLAKPLPLDRLIDPSVREAALARAAK